MHGLCLRLRHIARVHLFFPHMLALGSQLVAALIERIALMSAHPVKAHLFVVHHSVQLLPQITVFLFPVFAHGRFQHILAVRIQVHLSAPGQLRQPPHHSQDFHAVVGGGHIALRDFLALSGLAVQNHHAQTSGPAGIDLASAVCIDHKLCSLHFLSSFCLSYACAMVDPLKQGTCPASGKSPHARSHSLSGASR